MRHVLFVAFHYPPEASSSGVLRTLKYSRYLPEFGWRVSVITVDPSAYTICDSQLERQIPSGTTVLRTRFINTKRDLSIMQRYPALLALPDVWIGWMPWAVAAGKRLIAKCPPDLIYSTSPHATAHLIAARLGAISGKPWVADFRDPWVEDPPEPGAPTGRLFCAINRWLERLVVRRSAAVVTSTTRLRDVMRKRYDDMPETKIRAILNGYDEADFANAYTQPRQSNPRLRILHAGNINASFRDPRPLFEAVGRMVQRRDLTMTECEIRFVGGGSYAESTQVRAAIAEAGLSGSVTFSPRMSYEESLRELSTADVLLLLQASDDTVDLVPAKLYEYLRAQKPVLALVRGGGAVSEILQQTSGGWTADPSDITALDQALAEIVSAWRNDTLEAMHTDMAKLRRFDRRALAGELADVFNGVCSREHA